jgi:hypothetical protein
VSDIYKEQVKTTVQGEEGKVVGVILEMFSRFKDNLMADGGSPMASTFLQQSKDNNLNLTLFLSCTIESSDIKRLQSCYGDLTLHRFSCLFENR